MEHVAWEARLLVEEELDDAIVLFYETVHAVARCDYTGEQLDAWAPRDAREQRELRGKLREERVVGVWERGMLVGFGSLDGNSDIDMLYTHACAQGRGIATCILQELEALAAADGKETMCVDASLTSAPFFERRGYRTVRVQRVERRGVMLDNVHMAKRLTVGTMAYSYRSQWVAGQERYAVNIQIFGTKKSFDTKKAQRYFKERRIPFQFINLAEKPMSKGELQSVARAVGGLDALIDPDARDQDAAALVMHIAEVQRFEMLLENQQVLREPIVRNGRQATVGYAPDTWKGWS